jgi:hypothetical protein
MLSTTMLPRFVRYLFLSPDVSLKRVTIKLTNNLYSQEREHPQPLPYLHPFPKTKDQKKKKSNSNPSSA